MNSRHIAATILVALLAVACQPAPRPKDDQAVSVAVAGRTVSAERWERSRQCAEQAERLMKQEASELSGSLTTSLLGWQNHYSSQFERCYVYASFMNRAGDPKGGSPSTYWKLYDAFGHSVVAIHGLTPVESNYCEIEDTMVECPKARAYMDERMKK